jgi:penicillin-binding protein 1C
VLARRQAGSTLKPFLYEQAIEQRWLTAASVLEDSPARLRTPSGLYIPQNYDHDFKGAVTVRTALGSSLNVPAVRTAVMVTPDRFARRLVALGLPITKPGDFYGYGIALGSPEVTLLSLANAYRALADGGVAGTPRLLLPQGAAASAPVAGRAVMDPAASFVVADILADNGARVPTFGLDNALATRYWSAVKTGTSKDMRDNWCVGFSARYTVGVWVGNASGAPMHAVSGVTGAAPVWRAVMDAMQRSDAAWAHPGRLGPGHAARVQRVALETGARVQHVALETGARVQHVALETGARAQQAALEAKARDRHVTPEVDARAAASPAVDVPALPGAPAAPAGLVARRIDFAGGLEAARTEWFLAGTETAHVALASVAGAAGRRIASPDDGSVVAIDPDIPPASQRLRFEAVEPPRGAAWRLDGRRLGPARPLAWSPWPGRHLLELVDARGTPIDTVAFEVRGAQVAAGAASASGRAAPGARNAPPRGAS